MANPAAKSQRIFKTAWFSKASAKALISDTELCFAIRQVMLGQCDDLGGGVFKKRLDKNRSRSIILAKGGRYWVYEYLFAKKTGITSLGKNWLNFEGSPKSTSHLHLLKSST